MLQLIVELGLASLDISSQPIPQDGHFELDIDSLERRLAAQQGQPISLNPEALSGGAEKRTLDVRISVFPTVNGDATVCRLLNRGDALLSVDQLGLDGESLRRLKQLTKRSFGMILITGPVGSGKTTALYSLLQEVSGDDKTIVTIEDPVEFRFAKIRQIQIQADRGMTFAVGMKSILRQDPDIIMVGEIRDAETAEHAIRASLVGRIVFSTIHSNTTIGTIARLLDMKIEKSLIAYAMTGIISIRLVRKNCEHCRVPYEPADEYLTDFGLVPGEHQFMKSTGCDECGGLGYLGRTGIFEVLEFDDTLRAMIIGNASMSELSAEAIRNGMKTLRDDGLNKALQGIVTLENVAHVI